MRAVRLALGCGIAVNELVWWVFRYSHEGIQATNLPLHSYPAIYFFLAHGGVLVACCVLVFGRVAAIRQGAVWRTFAILAVYAALVGAFNAIFGANYMYLCRKPANPSLLDWLGPWPLYLVGSAVVALVLFWLLWLPPRPQMRLPGSAIESRDR